MSEKKWEDEEDLDCDMWSQEHKDAEGYSLYVYKCFSEDFGEFLSCKWVGGRNEAERLMDKEVRNEKSMGYEIESAYQETLDKFGYVMKNRTGSICKIWVDLGHIKFRELVALEEMER